MVRLFAERVVVDCNPDGSKMEEALAPLIELRFRYPAVNRCIRATDPTEYFLSASGQGIDALYRDRPTEQDARRVLESLGAVDVQCVETIGISADIDADYVVRIGGNAQQHCDFSAHAIPRLRQLGWEINIAKDFPYQVVDSPIAFWADVRPSEDSERPDWFALELGVWVDGERINLLPALIELLEESHEGQTLQQLNHRPRAAVPIGATRYVMMQTSTLRDLLQVVVELYEGSDGQALHLSLSEARVLSVLDQAFANARMPLKWNDPSRARQTGEALLAPADEKDGPTDLQAILRPYQREGLGWLQRLVEHDVGGVLADDMGLGKTLQTIAHIATEKAAGRLGSSSTSGRPNEAGHPALVVAPTSLMSNWARELKRFAPHLDAVEYHGSHRSARRSRIAKADVVLTSYPILLRDEEELASHNWHLVVLDEAHAIKNRRSRIHLAAKSLPARHRLCLTGTPVENHLGELWSLFDFLNPGLLGSAEYFKHWYRWPIERFRDEHRLHALREKVAPFILRRLKGHVATELPKKTTLSQPVELKGKQRELYESIRIAAHAQVRQLIRKKGFAASTIPVLDALMKLRQLCCDPRLVKMHAARFVRENAKAEAFFDLVETQLHHRHRMLVFSQFTSALRLLGEGLTQRKIQFLTLTGATKHRQALCDRFEQGEADVFLISLKAGGTGLNLVSADTVVHYDPWWNPQAHAQATDRAYRIGQTKPVFVYNLFVAGSVEERILHLQHKKKRLADAILAGELPDHALTEEDIDLLLAPLT